MVLDITTIIMTYNEEIDLPACLESVKSLGREIVVIDSGSTDNTAKIARQFGAVLIQHDFQNQAQQLNWAIDNVPITGTWLLRLDADERLSPLLRSELIKNLPKVSEDISGLYVKRQVHFMGKWIRHGGYYPTWILRVWKHGSARSENRIMDEHMVLSEGQHGFLEHDIVEESGKGLFNWTDKHNRYAVRELQAILSDSNLEQINPAFSGKPEERKRWLRNQVYGRLPLFIRPFLYFGYRYFVRLGFLDGRAGLVFHFLQGCWYRFQVDALLFEFRSKKSDDTDTA